MLQENAALKGPINILFIKSDGKGQNPENRFLVVYRMNI